MAKGTQKQDASEQAAVDAAAGSMHDSWRRTLLKTNPEQRGKPRMRLRGGVMVDVNQPWSKLHPNAQAEGRIAARDAYKAVKRFPDDREAASALVHDFWVKRNKGDPNQPKELFKPYSALSKVEKDKDRAHIDTITKAIAAVRKSAKKSTPRKAKAVKGAKASKANGAAAVKIDAQAWRRLQASAKQLSAALGRDVPAELLLAAGADAMAAVAKALATKSRGKR